MGLKSKIIASVSKDVQYRTGGASTLTPPLCRISLVNKTLLVHCQRHDRCIDRLYDPPLPFAMYINHTCCNLSWIYIVVLPIKLLPDLS